MYLFVPDRSSQRFNLPPSRYNTQPSNPQQHQQQARIGMMGPPSGAPRPYRPGMDHDLPPGRPPLPDEYKFSATELPRGSFTMNNKNSPNPNSPSSPWDRDEKDREALRRKEAARYWREQQIHELEVVGPNRNAAQEEQYRALR
jgi:afadin